MSLRELRWLLIIVALAVVARAAFFFLLVPYNPEVQSRDLFLAIARNVVDNKGFTLGGNPTAARVPGPPYFFALILWLLGDHTLSIAFSNWLVDATTCVLLYFIALEIFHSKQVALVSALLFALYGPGMYYSWQALSEPLFGLLLAAFVLSFLVALRSPSTGHFAITGALLGVASLTRPIMQYYLPVAIAILVWWLHNKQSKEILKWVLALSATFIIVLAPWTIRNYLVFDQIMTGSSHFGITLYDGNYALGESDFLEPHDWDETTHAIDKVLQTRLGSADNVGSLERDRIAREEAIKVIREYPGRYLLLSVIRSFQIWYLIRGSYSSLTYLILLMNGLLLVLATVAFLHYRGEWRRKGLILIILLIYYIAAHSAVIVSVRYSVPIALYVILFASVTIANIASPQIHLVPPTGRTANYSKVYVSKKR